MKVVILAGGLGTRMGDETLLRPKPMVEVGGRPLVWHIMKLFSFYGLNDFVICLGYKGFVVKEYFSNYFMHMSDVTFDLAKNQTTIHQGHAEPWMVTLIDTGDVTQTGGRLRRVARYLDGEDVCFTYGDGLADVNIGELVAFHKAQGRIATVTSAQPPGRFGMLTLEESRITGFVEKPPGDGHWVSAGYFVLSPGVFDYLDGDDTVWERGPLSRLATEGQLSAFLHRGFWLPVDHPRDRQRAEDLWSARQAPWKVWA
jgi:glucose-1-phosphate cytidylyltransferase